MSVPTDGMLRFSYHLTNVKYLQNTNSIKIDIDILDEIISKNIDVADLKNLFQIHCGFVHELLKKEFIYNENYIAALLRDFDGLYDSKEEAYRILFSHM